MCQFNLASIVIRALRKKHQYHFERELKMIIKILNISSKNEFYLHIYDWKIKHQDFLNEWLDKPNEKRYFP